MITSFIFVKMLSTIAIGLLISIALWLVCSVLILKFYPKYSLRMRHHLLGFFIAIVTFILYCSLSAVSASIKGIESTMLFVKENIIEKGDIIDQLASALSANEDVSTFNDVYGIIYKTVSANTSLQKHKSSLELIKFEENKDISQIMDTPNLGVSQKAELIIESLFDSYVKDYTKTLNRTWWIILVTIFLVQLTYFGAMIYRAESKSAIQSANISDLLKTGMYKQGTLLRI